MIIAEQKTNQQINTELQVEEDGEFVKNLFESLSIDTINKTNGVLIILQGVSGSGKSEFATRII